MYGLVAQWITRLTTDQKIPGSNPGELVFFPFHICVHFLFKDHLLSMRKEGNVLFNDTLNTFYLRLYGRERGTLCVHMGYYFRLAARVLLYASSHRQDNTYHGLCYTSHFKCHSFRLAARVLLYTHPI